MDNGLFITFEGSEGVGKSTQIQALKEWLEAQGYEVLQTREPGGTVVGEELRRIVKHIHGTDACCDETELLIFAASRAQLMRQVILPHLAAGGVVICDRFADSTTAYQGYARGWDMSLIKQMHDIAVCDRWPDLTLLMDMPLEVSVARRLAREANAESVQDRLEKEPVAFHQRVRDGFLDLAQKHPERIEVIDAAGSIAEVTASIQVAVQSRLNLTT